MAFLAIASAKGSPGATTLAVLLAAVWPRDALLAEFDPAGGDLVYRLRTPDGAALSPSAGLLGLAAGDEADPGRAGVLRHAQQVGAGLDVLVGPPPARTGELAGRWGELAAVLAAQPSLDVIADCGRLQPGSPSDAVLPAADAVVLVTRPTIDGVAHLLARAADVVALVGEDRPLYVVVVTDVRDTRSQREIDTLAERADLPVEVIGRLAYDPAAIGMLSGPWSGRLEKTLLVRSARGLADRLAEELAGDPVGNAR